MSGRSAVHPDAMIEGIGLQGSVILICALMGMAEAFGRKSLLAVTGPDNDAIAGSKETYTTSEDHILVLCGTHHHVVRAAVFPGRRTPIQDPVIQHV